jgi:hypothetical protein
MKETREDADRNRRVDGTTAEMPDIIANVKNALAEGVGPRLLGIVRPRQLNRQLGIECRVIEIGVAIGKQANRGANEILKSRENDLERM